MNSDYKDNNLKFVTEKDILSCYNDADIFYFYLKDYIPEYTLGSGIISSPFREDNNPSFGVFWGVNNNKWFFKDLGSGISGDCFNFVKHLFCLNSYKDALNQVAYDFGLDPNVYYIPPPLVNLTPGNFTKIKRSTIKTTIDVLAVNRDWKDHDYQYWGSLGVKKYLLKKYKVFPNKSIVFKTAGRYWQIKADKYSYTIYKMIAGKYKLKIYQPFNTNKKKWFNTIPNDVLIGLEHTTPEKHGLLITKSFKDMLVIKSIVDVNVVNIQAESVILSEKVMNELRTTFGKIILLFDNDKAGYKLADKYKIKFPWVNVVFTPQEKDTADFYLKNKFETIQFVKIITNDIK